MEKRPEEPITKPASLGAQFALSRLSRGDKIVFVGTIVLFISLFLDWFNASSGGIDVGSVSALNAHGYLYVVLILCLAIIGYCIDKAMRPERTVTFPVRPERLMLAGTVVNFLLTLIAFVFKPSGYGVASIGYSFGAIVGMLAAIAAVAPYVRPLLERLGGGKS